MENTEKNNNGEKPEKQPEQQVKKTVRQKIGELLRNERIREMISYLIFGALTTLVNWAVYYLMSRGLGLNGWQDGTLERRMIENVSQIVAWVISVLFAFVTNRRYVFYTSGKKDRFINEMGRFFLARVASFLIFDLLVFNILRWLSVTDLLDKLLMNILVVIFNYFASRFYVFRRRTTEKKQ